MVTVLSGQIRTILERLRQMIARVAQANLSPRKLALTVALGVTLGIIPVIWGSSLLCIAVAWLFRLNHACIQIVNYLSYPLQIALFLAFYRLGDRFFPSFAMVHSAAGGGTIMEGIVHAGSATLKAVGAWLAVAPLTTLFLYLILVPVFQKMQRRHLAGAAAQA